MIFESSNWKSFHPLALNAWFFLLEHQWAFESSVIDAYESLSRPRCEKMDLKSMEIVGKGSKLHNYGGKPKFFSEEQQTV